MLMTWQRQGHACLVSFILLAVLRSIPLPLSHTHTRIHTCMHIPNFILVQKKCCSLDNTMPRQDQSGVVRRRVCRKISQRCLCLASRRCGACLPDRQRWEWGRKRKLLVVRVISRGPLCDCFSLLCVMCPHHPRPPPLSPFFCHFIIWQMPPVTTALHYPCRPLLHPSGDGLELPIDVVVKREIDTDWMLWC